MRLARLAGILTTTATLGVGTVLAAPAASAQTGSLTLSIIPMYGGVAAGKTVKLTCEPIGGTHPDAAAACKDLTAAGGDISRIPPASAGCLDVWMPVIAWASGTWDGRPVTYGRQFSNAGCANVATGGHVFDF